MRMPMKYRRRFALVCAHHWAVEPCGRHEKCAKCGECRVIPAAKTDD